MTVYYIVYNQTPTKFFSTAWTVPFQTPAVVISAAPFFNDLSPISPQATPFYTNPENLRLLEILSMQA
jgi:hypothetical protein